MRDSIVGDAWIQQTAANVPIQRVIGADGQPTGDILTGPVRLCFENLFELPPATATMQNPKFGTTVLFSPYADFTILYEEYYKVCGAMFAANYDAASGQYYGLHSPFRQQAEKLKFGGFTPGLIFTACTSKFKPPVVDIRGNPIVDRSKVYAGVWAICGINAYGYNDPRKKGVAFGLQSVMIIGDDTRLSGGPADTKTMYQGVNVSAPIVRPDIAGMMPAGATPPPPGMPGMPARPGGPVPQVAQQHWTPPAPGAAMPPVPPAPVAADDDMSWNA
jgi:hypothetical protein